MPIYEYRCQDCGETSAFFVQRMGATPDELVCQHCQGRRLERATSTISVRGGGDSSPSGPACPTGTCPFAQN